MSPTDLSTLSLSKIAIDGGWYTPSSETPPPLYMYAHISLELVVQNVLEQFYLRTAMFPAKLIIFVWTIVSTSWS